jgi:hypothetical protein
LPKLFTEDLELAQSLEVETRDNEIFVKIGNLHYKTLAMESEPHSTLGSILSSAIACTLAKTLGQALILKTQRIFERERSVEIDYSIIDFTRQD